MAKKIVMSKDICGSKTTEISRIENWSILQGCGRSKRRRQYPKEIIGNMDETLLYFDMIRSWSLEKRGGGAKEVRVKSTGVQKQHITIILACTGDGRMLPPMIIFKGNIIFTHNYPFVYLCLSYRQDSTSYKRIDSHTWICYYTPKQSLEWMVH